MNMLSLDASTTCTGYAIFDNENLIAYGELKPIGANWQEKLCWLVPKIVKIIKEYKIEIAYVENVPLMGRQMETLVILGALQGMLLSIFSSMKVKVKFLMPTTWRSDIGTYDGTRQGMKREVQKEKAVKLANELFNLNLIWIKPKSTKNQDDVAEAICIGASQIKKYKCQKSHK